MTPLDSTGFSGLSPAELGELLGAIDPRDVPRWVEWTAVAATLGTAGAGMAAYLGSRLPGLDPLERGVNKIIREDEPGWRRNLDGELQVKRDSVERVALRSGVLHLPREPRLRKMYRNGGGKDLNEILRDSVREKNEIAGVRLFMIDRGVRTLKRFLLAKQSAVVDAFHTDFFISRHLNHLSALAKRAPVLVLHDTPRDLMALVRGIGDQELSRWLLLLLGDWEHELKGLDFTTDRAYRVRRRWRASLNQLARGDSRDGVKDWQLTGFRQVRFPCERRAPSIDTVIRSIDEHLQRGFNVFTSYWAPDERDDVVDDLLRLPFWDNYGRDIWAEAAPRGRKMRLAFVPRKAA